MSTDVIAQSARTDCAELAPSSCVLEATVACARFARCLCLHRHKIRYSRAAASGVVRLAMMRIATRATARGVARRPAAAPSNLPAVVGNAIDDQLYKKKYQKKHGLGPDHERFGRDWLHDGTKGFFEHQPGFLRARPRC